MSVVAMFRTVNLKDAVGLALAHDVTEVRKGEFKGRAFKKGHVVREKDLCHLQRLGKRHLFVLDIDDDHMHENDAVALLADALSGDGVVREDEPREGKLNLLAGRDGLLKVDVKALTRFNLSAEVMCASRHTNSLVKKGDIVAGTRAIPLVVKNEAVLKATAIARAQNGIFRVVHLPRAKIGLVITGSEVFTRLIEDQFEPVLRQKIDDIGSEVLGVSFAPDSAPAISKEIRRWLASGADMILTTGGMSVDPDDVTREGIRLAGGRAECYGAPVLPGAMLMLADVDDIPVIGIPACGLYHKTTILDLILPRIIAGEILSREQVAQMGHGGLCLNCPECLFPKCPFGK
jgi:hypothetical protein